MAEAKVPETVLETLRRLEGAGHEAFVVGGVVRDLLLKRRDSDTDWDLATRATPKQVMALFPRVVPTGIAHGTVTVVTEGGPLEVTTYRGEAEYSDGRRPDTVTFLERIEDDLARRDFTVNALAWSPLHDELRDPFDGQQDLLDRRLRAVGDPKMRFGEDGLRPLRAVRFAAVLDFEIESETLAAIPGALAVYQRVAVERLAQEMGKLLLGLRVDRGLSLLFETGLWRRLAPGADRALFVDRAPLVDLPPEVLPRWAGFLAPAGPEVGEGILTGLLLPRALQREVLGLLRVHQRGLPDPEDGVGLRSRLSALSAVEGPGEALAALYQALGGVEGGAAARALRAEMARNPPLKVAQLALSGQDVMAVLGVRGGPEVGETLRGLLEWVLEDPDRNTRSALTRWIEDRRSTGGA